jgi:hypothetical protein
VVIDTLKEDKQRKYEYMSVEVLRAVSAKERVI